MRIVAMRCAACGAETSKETGRCLECGAVAIEAANGAEAHLPPRVLERPWRCPTCGEQIDAAFDVCWSCGTSSDGVVDAQFTREEDVANDSSQGDHPSFDEQYQGHLAGSGPRPICPRCLSPDVLERGRLVNQDGVVRIGAVGPAAIGSGEIGALYCRHCGWLELRVATV